MASNVSGDGEWSETRTFEVDLVTGLESIGNYPETYSFGKVYPNPTDGELFFEFSVPEQIDVRIELYSATGQARRLVLDRKMDQGSYQVQMDLQTEPSGLYIIQMRAGNFNESHRFIINK